MLIHSKGSQLAHSKHLPSKGEVLAKRLEAGDASVKELYSEGRWKFEFGSGSETYQLDRKTAVEVMQNERGGTATYTVFGTQGSFDTLSEVDKKKRKSIAKETAIAKGVASALVGGMVIGGGAAVMNVLGDIGSILTRSSGGGGIGLGLGALGAAAGLIGLTVGVMAYKEGLASAAPEIVQTGYAKADGKGFVFRPNSESPDQRVVKVTKKSVQKSQ